MASASVKLINNARNDKSLQYGNIDYRPQFVCVNNQPVETTTQALSRLLFESGQMDRSAYDAVRGIQYDSDSADEQDSFDWSDDVNDDFIQSSFARYEELIGSEPDDISAAAPQAPATEPQSESAAEAPANADTASAE